MIDEVKEIKPKIKLWVLKSLVICLFIFFRNEFLTVLTKKTPMIGIPFGIEFFIYLNI